MSSAFRVETSTEAGSNRVERGPVRIMIGPGVAMDPGGEFARIAPNPGFRLPGKTILPGVGLISGWQEFANRILCDSILGLTATTQRPDWGHGRRHRGPPVDFVDTRWSSHIVVEESLEAPSVLHVMTGLPAGPWMRWPKDTGMAEGRPFAVGSRARRPRRNHLLGMPMSPCIMN